MKKIIALLLTLALVFTVVACTKTTDNNENDTPDTNDAAVDTEEIVSDDTADAPAADDASVAQTLVSKFKTLAADTSLDAQAIADALAAAEVLSPVGVATMPIEDVYLSGFDNYEVKGFAECVMFAPMIGTIPFVGYVFTVGDGVDATTFASDLEANANLRWNICTAADEVATAVDGTKVMFVMAPMSFEDSSDEAVDDGVADMGMDEEVPAYDGEMAE